MNENTPTILLADDEPHIVHVLSSRLRRAGYQLVTASNGREALDHALSVQPDLIIIDYQMPVMSGLEMAQQLKQHEQAGATPILMLTARGFTIPQTELARTNIVTMLGKPFSPREIQSRVEAILSAESPAIPA